MTTSTTDPQARFEMAWADLGERLVKGANNLREKATKGTDADDKNRLIDKACGVEYGIDLWEDFSTDSVHASGDFAALWRTFTDQMVARLAVDGLMPGYYQGLYLALDYQRGYGEDVDAPRVRPRAV
jgi:hypothetical protein